VALRPVAGVHEYVVAPMAFNTSVLPEQIVGDVADTEIVGVAFTVTATVCVPGHPAEFVPVTVYV